jgi:putative oxidoreductase
MPDMPPALGPYAQTLARILIGLLFLVAGLWKIADVPGLAAFLATGGLPQLLAWPAIAFEVALGAGIILGLWTRVLAIIGAGFCLATALLFHLDPGSYIQTIQLLKNLAIAGGFLMLAVHGPGRLALTR